MTVILRSALLRDAQGHPLCLMEQALDITERKLTEQCALELMAEKQQVEILNDFIRGISHEFRTPLATINASVSILKKTNDPHKREDATDRIAKQVKHLTRVLEQILTMSQLGSIESLPNESITLNALVKGAVTAITPLVDGKHLTVLQNLDDAVAQIQVDPE